MADQQPKIKTEEEYFKEIASSTAPVEVATTKGGRRGRSRRRSHRRKRRSHRRRR